MEISARYQRALEELVLPEAQTEHTEPLTLHDRRNDLAVKLQARLEIFVLPPGNSDVQVIGQTDIEHLHRPLPGLHLL